MTEYGEGSRRRSVVTDLLLNEEERMLQATVRDFADRELAPRAREWDEREEFSWDA